MADTASNTEQQVTSKTPATKQKNPKRVAAGKAVAERTRIAREAQRKAFIEAQSIIAQAKPPADPVADTPSADPVAGTPSADPVAVTPPAVTTKKRSHNNTMAEHHQHCRFSGGALLQTRRDQKPFGQKSRPTAFDAGSSTFDASASSYP